MGAEFAIGWIAAVIAISFGYALGLFHAGIWKQERPLQPNDAPSMAEEPSIRVINDRMDFVRSVKKPELGAVQRPSPEDIEKKERPLLKDEEDAWAEDMEQII